LIHRQFALPQITAQFASNRVTSAANARTGFRRDILSTTPTFAEEQPLGEMPCDRIKQSD
jgi:hypothetical protein